MVTNNNKKLSLDVFLISKISINMHPKSKTVSSFCFLSVEKLAEKCGNPSDKFFNKKNGNQRNSLI